MRALAGLRESPKFFAIRLLGLLRVLLLAWGHDLAGAGVLSQAEDIFFLHLNELDELAGIRDGTAQDSQDYADLVRDRRAAYERERARRIVPLVLLSDGATFYNAGSEAEAGRLSGAPVSPGVAEGLVRVVLDPHGVSLHPGEILVCPATDPAWTPLFLTVGGLVMEVGGLMTHGSVVAREYGIPAVVGVSQATQRLKTGQRVRVDGSSGLVVILDEDGEAPG
jgi:pyruvate,water dikinase